MLKIRRKSEAAKPEVDLVDLAPGTPFLWAGASSWHTIRVRTAKFGWVDLSTWEVHTPGANEAVSQVTVIAPSDLLVVNE